ncbi:hypothetical protein L6164_031882 [Bauhinia variegata]|uniref:Uncharacterized protein n=1 Tax=Bauhinia variegata TaxID=167791 RepID=A0ACB9KM10_BAUVA|nr:hypothetical protein L6164_031882 [Bauhinia variegata]
MIDRFKTKLICSGSVGVVTRQLFLDLLHETLRLMVRVSSGGGCMVATGSSASCGSCTRAVGMLLLVLMLPSW